MYQFPKRRAPLPVRLRKAYGMRLVREPLLVAAMVPSRHQISGPVDVVTMMLPFVAQEAAESFWAIPIDTQHRTAAPVVITRGILNSSLVHPRETFRAMIAANAASVVLCHNHPSGDPTPSTDDRKVTSQLVAAGRVLDMPVQDHIIIGGVHYFSFAEHGLL